MIDEGVFRHCDELVNVELHEGLESIHKESFGRCTSLRHISIPSTVDYIHWKAFNNCSDLAEIEFCNEIEEFLNEVPLPWWNHGVSGASLVMYSFLAQHHIPARFGTIKVREWKDNIHGMLQRIPTMISFSEVEEKYDNDEYFNSLNSQLINYEHAQDVAPLLELALWKMKILKHSYGNLFSNNENDVKLMCRTDSFSMFGIIFPNVLSFLVHE